MKRLGDWIDPALGMISFEEYHAAWSGSADRLPPTTLDKYDRAWRLDVASRTGSHPTRPHQSSRRPRHDWQGGEAILCVAGSRGREAHPSPAERRHG